MEWTPRTRDELLTFFATEPTADAVLLVVMTGSRLPYAPTDSEAGIDPKKATTSIASNRLLGLTGPKRGSTSHWIAS